MNLLYISLFIYITLLLSISYYFSRKGNSEDFLIAGRNRKGWQILISKFAGAIGASWFIAYTAYAYEFGMWMFVILVGILIGYFVFAYWAAPKIYKFSKQKEFYTQGDFVYNVTKSKSGRFFTNLVSMIIHFLWILVGIVGGAKVINYLGVLSYEFAVILTSSIILIYLLLAGFKAVIITDIIQGTIIMLLLATLSFFLIKDTSVLTIISSETATMGITTIVGFFLYGIMGVFSQSDRYQLCYSAKSVKTLRRGIGFAIIPIIIAAGFLLLIGLFIFTQNPNLDPDIVFIEAMQNYLPSTLLPLGVVLFFAGLMSSADTSVYAITSHYVLMKGIKEKAVNKIRVATIVLVIIATILSLIFTEIIELSIVAGSMTLVMSLPMIYIISNGRNSKRFLASIFGGFAGLVIGLLIFGIAPELALTVIIGGTISLFYKGRS